MGPTWTWSPDGVVTFFPTSCKRFSLQLMAGPAQSPLCLSKQYSHVAQCCCCHKDKHMITVELGNVSAAFVWEPFRKETQAGSAVCRS